MIEWIKCSDRMPERSHFDHEGGINVIEGVLVWISYIAPWVEDLVEGKGWVDRARLNWKGVWVDIDDSTLTEAIEGCTVTHWMPLPPPPVA